MQKHAPTQHDVVLETKRTSFVPLSLMHAQAIHKLYTPRVAQFMYIQPEKTLQQTIEHVKYCIKKTNIGCENFYFSIMDNDYQQFIGCAGIRVFMGKNIQPRFWLAEDVWKNGYGTEVMKGIITFAKRRHPSASIFTSIHHKNIPAHRTLSKAGGTLIEGYSFHSENVNGLQNRLVTYTFS